MTPDSLHDAVLARVEKRVAENYQDAEGRSPVDPHAVAVIVAPAALAAIEEQGMVIVSAEDLRAVVGETRSYETYTAALPRLRAVLSGTAPQPSEAPQGAETCDGGISGPSDNPGASAGLSAPHADDLHRRYAEAIRHALFGPHSGDAAIDGVFDRSAAPAARAVLAVRDTELEQLRAALHTYENTITWFTTCHGCAKTLDSSYAETVRAEKAEAALVHAKALHSRDDSNPHGPWCGTCTTHWPCRTWTALLPAGNPPAPRELEAARAAIARVRRLCELTIAASCRVQAIDQARDTLAALDSPEEP